MDNRVLPIFALDAVLFPGGEIPLRIFEPRYLDMVSDCLKKDTGFGVCLIRSGQEVGPAAATYEVGTFARITDWRREDNGLLGITATGEQRFRVLSTEIRPDQLLVCCGELVPDDTAQPVPTEMVHLAELAQELAELFLTGDDVEVGDYSSACWVSYRLAEHLPVPDREKQRFLEIDDPIERLTEIETLLKSIDLKFWGPQSRA